MATVSILAQYSRQTIEVSWLLLDVLVFEALKQTAKRVPTYRRNVPTTKECHTLGRTLLLGHFESGVCSNKGTAPNGVKIRMFWDETECGWSVLIEAFLSQAIALLSKDFRAGSPLIVSALLGNLARRSVGS